MRDVAQRIACDVGTLNQEGRANARVVHVLFGTDAEGPGQHHQLGQMTYDALLRPPESFSSPALRFDPDLRSYLDAQRLDGDWYQVFGGEQNEGAVVVSQIDEPVDYSAMLSGRVANLVSVYDVAKRSSSTAATRLRACTLSPFIPAWSRPT